jgi:hypothetical protein
MNEGSSSPTSSSTLVIAVFCISILLGESVEEVTSH